MLYIQFLAFLNLLYTYSNSNKKYNLYTLNIYSYLYSRHHAEGEIGGRMLPIGFC